jgi:Flp pilus assembly protein TadD
MAAAAALGARFVLDGTLQAEGEELRVTARLTDAKEGTVVWSHRWARPVEDVFAVQDEIVGRIGRAGQGTPKDVIAQTVLAGAEGRPLRSLDAYELYLLGDEAKYNFTPEGFEEAIGYLRRAIEIDPDFTAARVALSIAVINWSDHMDDEAEAAALVAESFRLAEQAAEADPDDPYALVRLCTVRVLQDRRAEAWPLAARAVEIAPLSPDLLADAAWCYPFADQGRAPLDWAKRAVALNPAHGAWYNVGLAMSALFAGDLDLARRAGRAAPPRPDVLITLGAAEALSGNIEEARAWFDRFAAETRYRSLSGYMFVDDLGADPAWGPWVEGARLAGFPLTEADANPAASR